MEYIYAAMLLHKAGKKIDEESIKKILKSAGVEPNEARVKSLVASLEGVNINEAIKKSVITQAAPSAPAAESKPEAKEKKKEPKEEKKTEEEAAAGLGALFG